MNPEKFRLNFRRVLGEWFRIDDWSLGLPEPRSDVNKPPSVGREKPMTELESITNVMGYSDKYHFFVQQTFSFQVLYRIPNRLTYDEVLVLYRSPLENIVCAFGSYLQRSPGCLECSEINKVKAKVASPELKQGDWLLSCQIEGVATYPSDPINTALDKRFI